MRNEVFDVEIKCWRDGEHHCTTFVCILLHINTDALTSGWEEKMQRCVVPKAPVSRPRRRSHASRPRSCPPRLFSPPPQSRPAPRGCPPCPPPQSRPAPRGCPPSPPPQSRPRGCPPSPPPQSRPRGCPPSPPPQSPQSRPRGARGWLSAPAAVQAGTARLSAQSAAAVEAVQCSWDQAGCLGDTHHALASRSPQARLPAAKAAARPRSRGAATWPTAMHGLR
jgi:hypothetical protein